MVDNVTRRTSGINSGDYPQCVIRLETARMNAIKVGNSIMAHVHAVDIRDTVIALRDARAERDEAREAIAWANNSLYGSHGFFLSTRGDTPNDPHHLDRPIEDMKARCNQQWQDLTAARTRIAELEAALRELAASIVRIQQWGEDTRVGRALISANAALERSDIAEPPPHLHFPFGWDPSCATCRKEKVAESPSAPEPQP